MRRRGSKPHHGLSRHLRGSMVEQQRRAARYPLPLPSPLPNLSSKRKVQLTATAFCRIFRIGQNSPTFITRLIVRDTVDEKLQNLQDSKQEAIGAAIDDSRMLDKLSLTELMRLFGPVGVGEDRRPFILVEGEGEEEAPA